MKTAKRITSLLLAVALAFSLAASCFAVDTALTRQEAAEMLVQAADDYHRGVKTEDILKGYPDGNLDLRGTLTRAQALVMLDRAFGGLPAPVGDHARTAAGMQGFSDAPVWGGEELSRVLSSGIVAGEADGLLHPDAPVTRENLQTLLSRVYALEGTNRKDDFYETVNKTLHSQARTPDRCLPRPHGAASPCPRRARISRQRQYTSKRASASSRSSWRFPRHAPTQKSASWRRA